MSATYMWRLDNDKENKGTPQNDCNKFIEELRLWMSDQDIRLQPSVKQVPLPEEHETKLGEHIKAIRALMVKLDDEERKQLQGDFVLTWNPKGTKFFPSSSTAMRRLGGPVPVPSHNGLERTPVKVQAVAEKQVGERPLDKGPVAPLRASKGKKRNVDNSDKTVTKKSRGKKRSLDDSEDTTSNSIENRQGKKRRSENDDDTVSKKRRTGTIGDYGVPETMPEFVEGSSSGRNRNAGNYGLFSATSGSNENWEATFTVKPSTSSPLRQEDGSCPANRNPGSSAQRGIVPVGEGSGTTPGVRTDESRAPLLYAVGSGLPPRPSDKQNSGQAHYNSCTLPPGPSVLEDQHAEQLDPQRQVGYAHEHKLPDHMSYPSSQTGDAGIDQEISAVLPHGQEQTSHDVVGLEDEEEENHTETETTYDWSREQDMFVQSMVDPASEMEEGWTALMQDDTIVGWWDGMCVLEESWGETWGEMMESEDGTRSWNAI